MAVIHLVEPQGQEALLQTVVSPSEDFDVEVDSIELDNLADLFAVEVVETQHYY